MDNEGTLYGVRAPLSTPLPVLSLQVALPPALTGEGGLSAADPRVRALRDELETLNRRLQVWS